VGGALLTSPTDVFLGVKFTVQEDLSVKFAARDKQHNFDFKVVRFPSTSSAMPKSVLVGTVIGMLVRTITLTSTFKDLWEEFLFLFRQFRERGYTPPLLRDASAKFAQRHIVPHSAVAFRTKLIELIDKSDSSARLKIRAGKRPREDQAAAEPINDTQPVRTAVNTDQHTGREAAIPVECIASTTHAQAESQSSDIQSVKTYINVASGTEDTASAVAQPSTPQTQTQTSAPEHSAEQLSSLTTANSMATPAQAR
jgi:hypothetical protein